MGLGINREEREGPRRGIYLWDWGLTARCARVREGDLFMGLGINREEREGARRGRIFNRKECGGITRWDLTQIMQMHNLG
jgi:hypothetical protein